MSAASHITFPRAKIGQEAACRRSGSILPSIVIVARSIWPRKTDVELASRAGVSDRAARDWLAGRANLSADALGALLQSDDGLAFLEAVMGEARPAWWRGFKRAKEISALRRAQEETRRRLEQLETALD